ncbi:MAG: hypothetical protein U1E50_10960 [Caulobacteraceae bacterium]
MTPAHLPTASSVWLTTLEEASTNDLRIVVLEVMRGAQAVETELGLATPMRPDLRSRAFEIIWWGYVAYAVRNESYFKDSPGQAPDDFPLGVVQGPTPFRDYVMATTFATDDFPGPLSQWVLATEWHVIDVVSTLAPEIRQLSEDEVSVELAKLERGRG